MSEFDEYIVHGKQWLKEKADAWQTAIEPHNVDGLKILAYLLDTTRKRIEGDISIDEALNALRPLVVTKFLREIE